MSLESPTFADPSEMSTTIEPILFSVNSREENPPGCKVRPELFLPVEEIDSSGRVSQKLPRGALRAAQEICAECVYYVPCETASIRQGSGIWAGVNRRAAKPSREKQQAHMVELRRDKGFSQ